MVRLPPLLIRPFYTAIQMLMVVLVLFVLFEILAQYRWYFPANFRAPGFLLGRESFFAGNYRIAFYLHILCGPIAVVLGMFLYGTGQKRKGLYLHRFLGKLQFFLVVFILSPSGLVMATRAHTGKIAGVGFALLSIATLVAAFETVRHIRSGCIPKHQRWATRLLILLLSPIALRLLSVGGTLLQAEPNLFYPFSAWASWLIPIAIFETLRYFNHTNQLDRIPKAFPLENLDGE